MTWRAVPDRHTARGRVWQDDANPTAFRSVSTVAPLHYADANGVYQPVDATPVRVNTAQLDGWTVTANGWHFALGKRGGAGADGWVGFGGQRGARWFWSRLVRVGYLHWPTRAWQDIGGAPTYARAKLASDSTAGSFGPDTLTPVSSVSWSDLWTTPGSGSVGVSWAISGDGVKEVVRINNAARTWIKNNRAPTTPAAETYFGLVFQVDASDIPRLVRNGVVQDMATIDVADDDQPFELRDASNALLGLLPVDRGFVDTRLSDGTRPSTPLRKRLWKDSDGNWYLSAGVRCDTLATAPDGDLLIDPTIQISTNNDDGFASAGGVDYEPNTGGNLAGWVGSLSREYMAVYSFPSTGVPQGATITAAALSVYDEANTNAPLDLKAVMQKIASASQPDNSTNKPFSWTYTTAASTFSGTPTVNAYLVFNDSNFIAVVQEVVNQASFDAGRMNTSVRNNGMSGGSQKTASFYDYNEGVNSAKLAKLDITYTTGGGTAVSATIAATSTLTARAAARRAVGRTIAALSSATMALASRRGASATILATSAVAAAMAVRRAIAAAIPAQSSVTISLVSRRAVSATISGQASIVPVPTVRRAVRATAAVSSTMTVALGKLTPGLNGTIACTSTMNVTLGVRRPVAFTATASSTMSITAQARRSLTAQAAGISSANITATARRAVNVTIPAISAMSAAVTAPVETPAATPHGKYRPEHDSALADLAAATGFSSEHASALRDLSDAGF